MLQSAPDQGVGLQSYRASGYASLSVRVGRIGPVRPGSRRPGQVRTHAPAGQAGRPLLGRGLATWEAAGQLARTRAAGYRDPGRRLSPLYRADARGYHASGMPVQSGF